MATTQKARTGKDELPRVIGADSDVRKAGVPAASYRLSEFLPPFVAFGFVLCGVGLIDLGMAWWPLRFGTGEWEFGIASRTFDSLALGTTGFIFLVGAASVRGRPLELRILGALSLLVLLVLLGAAFLFVSNAPIALSQVPAEARSALVRAITRTTSFAVLYIVLFSWLSWFTWRRSGAAAKGGSSC